MLSSAENGKNYQHIIIILEQTPPCVLNVFLKSKVEYFSVETTTEGCKKNGPGKGTRLCIVDSRLIKISVESNKEPEVGGKQNWQQVHHIHLYITQIYASDKN